MKKYFVKVVHTATEGNHLFAAGEKQTWFVGKGGYSRKKIKWLSHRGWSRRCYAEQYIKKCQAYSEELKHHGVEFWTHEYEIIEVE